MLVSTAAGASPREAAPGRRGGWNPGRRAWGGGPAASPRAGGCSTGTFLRREIAATRAHRRGPQDRHAALAGERRGDREDRARGAADHGRASRSTRSPTSSIVWLEGEVFEQDLPAVATRPAGDGRVPGAPGRDAERAGSPTSTRRSTRRRGPRACGSSCRTRTSVSSPGCTPPSASPAPTRAGHSASLARPCSRPASGSRLRARCRRRARPARRGARRGDRRPHRGAHGARGGRDGRRVGHVPGRCRVEPRLGARRHGEHAGDGRAGGDPGRRTQTEPGPCPRRAAHPRRPRSSARC